MKIKKINIYGCPNAGKSVAAAIAYAQLACDGYSIELVREVHKEFIANHGTIPTAAIHELYDEQRRREACAARVADLIITDGPLGLCDFYARRAGVRIDLDLAAERAALNVLINPDFSFAYDVRGRVHAADSRRDLQNALVDHLVLNGIDFSVLQAKDIRSAGARIAHLLEVNA